MVNAFLVAQAFVGLLLMFAAMGFGMAADREIRKECQEELSFSDRYFNGYLYLMRPEILTDRGKRCRTWSIRLFLAGFILFFLAVGILRILE